MKTIIQVNGVMCQHCSNQIEEELNRLPGIEKAVVQFLTGKIEIFSEDEVDMRSIKDIIFKHEPGVTIDSNEIEAGSIPYRLIIALALFFSAFLVPNGWIKTALFLVAFVISGYEVIFTAVKNLLQGAVFDENFLMGLATIGAIAIGEYGEAAAVMIFYEIGEFFQDLAVVRSKKSIRNMMELKIDKVHKVTDEGTVDIEASEVQVGDIFMVKPGEKIGLDGRIVEGFSSLQTATISGESIPKDVQVGDEVISGSVNLSATLKVKAEKPFSESTVSKIMDLVEHSSDRKAVTEQFITKFARIYTPVVVFSAVLLVIIGTIFFQQDLSTMVHRSLLFLVISCPCALVLSIPLSYFAGLGAASKYGLVMKGANYLEALDQVDTVVMDKTGTITKGIFLVQDILGSEETLFEAAKLEQYSNHPIGKSILSAYQGELPTVQGVQEFHGEGLYSEIENLAVGNRKLMDRFQVKLPQEYDGTTVYVAKGGQYIGTIIIGDELKENAALHIDQLREQGINDIHLLTGDNSKVAEKIASDAGINNVKSNLLPQDKVKALEDIMESTPGKVLFCGDGTNDSPSLALSDIGVAMGDIGSDAALEASDAVLMDGSLQTLSKGLGIAHKTKKIVMQNIVFILFIKVLVMTLGALGYASMWMAVFADVGVSLLAVLNTLRLLRL